MKTHYLKTWPKFFNALLSGEKNFEVRVNDRNFEVGDRLVLQEWEPCSDCNEKGIKSSVIEFPHLIITECPSCESLKGSFTGREITKDVGYVLNLKEFIPGNKHVVMALKSHNTTQEPPSPPTDPELIKFLEGALKESKNL